MRKNIDGLCKGLVILLILLIMVVGCGTMLWGELENTLQANGVFLGKKADDNSIYIDWEALYPFEASSFSVKENTEEFIEDNTGIVTKIENTYLDIIKKLKSKLEHSSEYVAFRMEMLEANGKISKLAGKTEFAGTNGVIQLKNGYLSEAVECDNNVPTRVANIVDFNNWLEEKGIPFLYVQLPHKNSKYDNQLPDDIVDYTNFNMDNLLAELEEENVAYIDFRERMQDEGINSYDMFYKTDHHWTVDAGRWAAGELAEELNEKYNMQFVTSLLQTNLYEEKTYEKWWLGSRGRKVTLGFAEPEDFTIYTPTFDTDFRVIYPDLNIDVRGTFADVMYDSERLNKKDYYNSSTYECMLYGNRPLTKITNYNAENGNKVLIIKDSFTLAMAPYFSLLSYETDLIDIREAQGNFTGSVRAYVEEMQPDVVIVMYCWNNNDAYDFQ